MAQQHQQNQKNLLDFTIFGTPFFKNVDSLLDAVQTSSLLHQRQIIDRCTRCTPPCTYTPTSAALLGRVGKINAVSSLLTRSLLPPS